MSEKICFLYAYLLKRVLNISAPNQRNERDGASLPKSHKKTFPELWGKGEWENKGLSPTDGILTHHSLL